MAPVLNLDIDARSFHIDLSERTYVMAVLNVTPDSFSDGGKFFDKRDAIAGGLQMADEGADIIDVGGESTRPGAKDVSFEEERDRVVPVIAELSRKLKIPLSIDTRKSRVAEEAVKAGAGIINDVSGLRYDQGMAQVAARYGVGVIVMHMKGTPEDMQSNPTYTNLMGEIIESLRESIEIAKKGGVSEDKIIVDPGIGFGKTVEHNLEILNRLDELKVLGRPICIGTSRKSFIGKALGLENPADRLAGTLATCAIAVMKGANILRVHDVKGALQVSRMADSIINSKLKSKKSKVEVN